MYEFYPSSIDEIFDIAEKQDSMYICDTLSFTNPMAMSSFLSDISSSNIIIDDGTQAFLWCRDYDYVLQIDCGGAGDFNEFIFEFTKIPFKEWNVSMLDYNILKWRLEN